MDWKGYEDFEHRPDRSYREAQRWAKAPFLHVEIPAGATEQEILRMAIMQLLHLSEEEARRVMAREQAKLAAAFRRECRIPNPEGRMILRLRFDPAILERTESWAQMPQGEGGDLYEQFRAWLRGVERSGSERAPLAELFDQWARGQGLVPEYKMSSDHAHQPQGGDAALASYQQAMREYEQKRTEVIERVLLERLRNHRIAISKQIGTESESLRDYLLKLAQQAAVLLPAEEARDHTGSAGNDSLFDIWLGVHLEMLQIDRQLILGTAGDIFPEGLADRIYHLAWHLARHADDRFAVHTGGEHGQAVEYPPERAQILHDLLEMGQERRQHDNRLLLLEYYRLHFALFETMGREKEYRNAANPLIGKAENRAERDLGTALRHRGKRGRKLLDFLEQHPYAQKVNAIFYPEHELQHLRLTDPEAAGAGQELQLYLWYDALAREWVLEDFTDLEEHARNSVQSARHEPVPGELFENLNHRFRLPKGALYYRLPTEGSYRIMRTTAEMEWYDWLRWAALAGIIVATAFATAGASVPATVVLIGGGLANAAAATGELLDKADHGRLETLDVVIGVADVISSLALAGSSGARLALSGAKGLAAGQVIRSGEHTLTRLLTGVEVGADTGLFLLFSGTAYADLQKLAEAEPQDTAAFARALGLLMGLGLVQVVGIKGSLKEAMGLEGGAAVDEVVRQTQAERAFLAKERVRLRELKLEHMRGKRSSLVAELDRFWTENKLADLFPHLQVEAGAAMVFGEIKGKIPLKTYRRLFAIVSRLARNEAGLSVQSVILYLEKLGMRLRGLDKIDEEIIQIAIRDVKREDMSPEEIAFAEQYFLNNPTGGLTNYELREMHRQGYTINPRTGQPNAPQRSPDYYHRQLEPGQRTKMIDFQKKVNFDTDPVLQALVSLRKKQRAEVAKLRKDIKRRQEAGEEISKQEMKAFHQSANEVGLYSEKIAERSLKKYLDDEGFVQVYPEIGAPSAKAGDFDRIYVKEEGGRYLVFEVKGGQSPIGTRKVTDVPEYESSTIAEQGTRPYFLQILVEMGKKEKTRELAFEMRNALQDGDLDYLFYRQDFTNSGDLKPPEIGQFDIRE